MLARRNTSLDVVPRPRATEAAAPQAEIQPEPRQDSLLEIAFRHKLTIALATVMCICAGVVFLKVVTPRYVAASRLYVQPHGPRIIGNAPAPVGHDEQDTFLFTQREIIHSAPVLAIALNNLGDLKTF